jgi:type I restriction enzyme S subunit
LAINQKVNKGSTLEWQYAKELSVNAPIADTQIARRWDVLVNCLGEGTLGRVHLFKEINGRFAVDQHMSICRGAASATGLYLYQVLSSPEGQAKIEILKSGSTGMSMLNISKLREFDLLYPSDPTVHAYEDLCTDLFERVAHNESESRTLAEARDLLLPRLMSGELRVADLAPSDRETAA